MKRNRKTWDYNRRQLQGLTSDVCGKYCCLFAIYMDWGYTPKQFISLFVACKNADRWVDRFSLPNSGLKCHVVAGVNAAEYAYKS